MALTTTTAKRLFAWLTGGSEQRAATFIVNLIAELEARFVTAEGKANTQRFSALVPANALAADVVGETTFAVVRAAGATTATGIDLVFSGAITAHDTDYATITLRKRTGAGAGIRPGGRGVHFIKVQP